jgi:hypothetical protein
VAFSVNAFNGDDGISDTLALCAAVHANQPA